MNKGLVHIRVLDLRFLGVGQSRAITVSVVSK